MKYIVCSVFDVAAQAFGRPFFSASLGLAVRGFGDEVGRASPDNPIHQHPADFRLFHLGEFDDEPGHFSLLDQPVLIASASDFVESRPK